MNKAAIPEMIEWCRKLGYEVRPRLLLLRPFDEVLISRLSPQTLIA